MNREPERYPLVYIIVLCHNSMTWLDKCLSSLLKTSYVNYKIMLIDNASEDGSARFVRENYPEVLVIENQKNMGWCEGNNIGIRRALSEGANYVVLLNSDVKAEQPMWLKKLVDFVEHNPYYGIAGCVQYEYFSKGWATLNGWSHYILDNGNWDPHYMWDPILKTQKTKPAYTESDIATMPFIECYFVQGAAMLVRREVFERIGLFDPIYFIFLDEVDFSRRARKGGYKTALVPESRIKHVEGGDNSSTDARRRRRNYYYSRNKYIFVMSDVEKSWPAIFSIIWDWIKYDFKDSVGLKENISNLTQFIVIISSLFAMIPRIIIKRHNDGKIVRHNES